jgi:hypothetical protein
MSITDMQVNDAMSEVYPWRTRTKATSTAATTIKKSDLPLFCLKYALKLFNNFYLNNHPNSR